MADNIEEVKANRSKAKQSVTVAARRLTGSIQRGSDMEILQVLMTELDKAFSDFLIIDEDFEGMVSPDDMSDHRIVNNQNLEQYKETVFEVFDQAADKFRKSKAEEKQIQLKIKAGPHQAVLKRNISTLKALCSSIDETCTAHGPNIESLRGEKEELDSLVNQIVGTLEKVKSILPADELLEEEKEVDSLCQEVFKKKRKINIMLAQGSGSRTLETGPVPSSTYVTTPDYFQTYPVTSVETSLGYMASPTLPIYNQVTLPSTSGYGRYYPQSTLNPMGPNVTSTNVEPMFDPRWSTPQPAPTMSSWSTGNNFQGSLNQTYIRPPTPREADIKLKKITLPFFSGQRKDWPEFKAVWRELAERSYVNKTALAHELKNSVKGEAAKRIRSVYITKPEAYDIMWHKLEAHYDNTSASVQAALDSLQRLKLVKDEDFKGLIDLIDEVESTYSQLEELGELSTLTMRDVDKIISLLPSHLRHEWNRKYHDLPAHQKIKPFAPFMNFLDRERESVARLADSQASHKRERSTYGRNVDEKDRRSVNTHQSKGKALAKKSQPRVIKKFFACAFPGHRVDSYKHSTEECREFQKLPVSGLGSKYETLKEVNACFICFGDHRRENCPNRKPCVTCNETEHHTMLCRNSPPAEASSNHIKSFVESNATSSTALALYPIHQVAVAGTSKQATVFCDGGSNTSYITHQAADRLQAKSLGHITLEVTTMGNVERTYDTRQYEVWLQTQSGKRVKVLAYGMCKISGSVSKLDLTVLGKLFPDYNPHLLQRKSSTVDILLGCDNFGLHPKQEIVNVGNNLSIMRGELGICLQGTHPGLKEETSLDSNLARVVHNTRLKVESNYVREHSHKEFLVPSKCPVIETEVVNSHVEGIQSKATEIRSSAYSATSISNKSFEASIGKFIMAEDLATETTPKCGGCRCGKCPTIGHTYSFKEEQELKMIQDNLEYDDNKKCWVTSYPWLVDPMTLPDNYKSALGTLFNTERTLKKDPNWATTYQSQIQDMLDRGVARKLSLEEINSWKGPKYYLCHLAVVNSRSQTTPVRIVFNSSQISDGVSLNSCLAKGPDCYLNNLIGLLLRWREEQIAVVGDIRKMFNSVLLKMPEQHCHRFLWRDQNPNVEPAIYVVTTVNFGDKPAPAISTEAIYKTADLFREDSPRAAELLRKSSYVDDLIDSFKNIHEAQQVVKEAEEMLSKGGFLIKCWQYSGESSYRQPGQQEPKLNSREDAVKPLLKGTSDNLRVLGVGWMPTKDVLTYQVALNFSKKKKGQRTEPNLTKESIRDCVPIILTRRLVLEQVMAIYDPLGLVCPFTLLAKVYLRETWKLKLGWDDQLPDSLRAKWVNFFSTMFEMENLQLERCLRPQNSVGDPWLIILADGSDLAYGFAAYVRWKLTDGSYQCRLIMAKCRIAPVNKISTPQLELNAAVLAKRGRLVIQKESRFDFGKVLQLVDSETVLNMINKTSTRFKVYEGVRIGEIQAATNGDMSCWAWISGDNNTADWLTRGRTPNQLNSDSEWWKGPPILYSPVEEWGLKYGLQKDILLPGEKKICVSNVAETVVSLINYSRFSNIKNIIGVVAILLNIIRLKSFKAGKTALITPELLRESESWIVKDIQKTIHQELVKSSCRSTKGGHYSKLNPTLNSQGLWVVGQRLQRYNAMTGDSELQKLLPTSHQGTRLFMKRAHESGHRGRDATLASFRQQYWTPHGDKLAKAVKQKCQLCKLREPSLLQQEMGMLPEVRLKPSTPFNHTMVDLFGPYLVRGEVQKRTSGKAYGVIFTDLVMRAVHIEAVFGYDTSSFLMALSRFASMRGWPETVYSDPGSQLIGAERELKEAWEKMDKDGIVNSSAEKGLKWVFGPADSPWYQGAVESLVKAAKRAIHFSVHNQRLSVPEFLTVCTEVANLLNERPIGYKPSIDSDITVLTPNSLLLGRSTSKNPGGWQPVTSINSRYNLIQQITDQFWKKWVELYAPILVTRQKWSKSSKNLKPGDVVLIADRNVLKGEYRLGRVKEIFCGDDGRVRKATVTYKNFRIGEKVNRYRGAPDTSVTRSVQRLCLLVPTDDSVDCITV